MGFLEETEPMVDTIMSSPVIAVTPGESLARTARVMVEANVGCVVVVEGGHKVVGILTERDILRGLEEGDLAKVKVREAMSNPVISVEPGTHCAEALETMVSNGIRRLPVLDDGRIVGSITERDIMGWLLDNPDEFASLLPEVDPHVVRDALVAAAQSLRRRTPKD